MHMAVGGWSSQSSMREAARHRWNLQEPSRVGLATNSSSLVPTFAAASKRRIQVFGAERRLARSSTESKEAQCRAGLRVSGKHSTTY